MRFTVRIQPYQNESLVGFLYRLCEANHMPFAELLFNYGKRQALSRPKDNIMASLLFHPEVVLEASKLCEAAMVSEIALYSMTCYPIISKFKEPDKTRFSRILEDMIRTEYSFCPVCITEQPFHGLLWAIKDVQICAKHQCFLQSKCPACDRPLLLRDIRNVSYCPYCGSKLSNIATIHVPTQGNYNAWVNECLEFLRCQSAVTLSTQEVATKILYLHNCQEIIYCQDAVLSSIGDTTQLRILLKYCKGTGKQHLTLSLRAILDLLRNKGISMEDFFALQVPDDFLSSVHQDRRYKQNGNGQYRFVPRDTYSADDIESRVRPVLDIMLTSGQAITVDAVSKQTAISRTALYRIGAAPIILQKKESQFAERQKQKKQLIIHTAQEHISHAASEKISVREVYKAVQESVGHQKTVITRSFPEVVPLINSMVRAHNLEIVKQAQET